MSVDIPEVQPCCDEHEMACSSSDDEYEDARESPLEQRISEAMTKSKDNGSLFSFVPRGVYQPPPVAAFEPISNPDSFHDFFRLLAPSKPRNYRRGLPIHRDRSTYNLWSIIKNLIGKDITRIALPIHLNEPLSLCQVGCQPHPPFSFQSLSLLDPPFIFKSLSLLDPPSISLLFVPTSHRLTEDIEYSDLLHKAAGATTISKRMSYLAALASSCYVATLSRHSKPFNPLLGETYELVNTEDKYCVISEQVSHHPPVTALHVESEKWVFWEEYKLEVKFRGQWVRIQSDVDVHFRTKDDGFHYSWSKPHTTVHNLILGSLWADHEGDVVVTCHQTGDEAVVTFSPYSKARERYRELNGKVFDSKGEVQYVLHGAWDKGMTRRRTDGTGVKELWKAHDPVPNSETQYGFSQFVMRLNEPDEAITCPTDSRKRPDQRLLEDGKVDDAASEKYRLEEKQRASRRLREMRKEKWKPRWFDWYDDPDTNTSYYAYNGKYWDSKLRNDWSMCPDIF